MEKRRQSLITDWFSLTPSAREAYLRTWASNLKPSLAYLKEVFISEIKNEHENQSQKLELSINLISILSELCLRLDSEKQIKQEESKDSKPEAHQTVCVVSDLLVRQNELLRINENYVKQVDSLVKTKPEIEALFFPDQANTYRIISELMKAQKQVKVAMYYFTDEAYLNALKKLSRKDVVIKLIYTEMNQLKAKTLGTKLLVKQIPYRKVSKKYSNFMHHKFIVIDQKTVMTGSLNWTRMSHNENVVIIRKCEAIAKAFSREFDKLFE